MGEFDPKQIVKSGYDKVSWAYRSEQLDQTHEQYFEWVNELRSILADGANVLELGCGCGLPATKLMSETFKVTGVDISPVQIERAKRAVPTARFIEGDMTTLNFTPHCFEAIVSFYAIIHLPLEEQLPLFIKLKDWLKPDGYLLMTVGSNAWTGIEDNWLGVPGGTMYWSHADSETYLNWLEKIGFEIKWCRFIPEGTGGHSLILAHVPV